MIGIGKWQATVSAFMFNVTGVVEIRDNGGEYEFIYQMPEKLKNVKVKYYGVEQIGPNTLRGKGEISSMPGKVITVEATFNGDTMSGTVKMGAMSAKIKNGRRIG